MSEGKLELELDLEPKHGVTDSAWELLVPIHADNFALALAAGYVGGSLKIDAAEDLQSRAGDGLVGFNAEVPSWAVLEGEPGDRVLLCIERRSDNAPKPGSVQMLDGPLRVTKLQAAYFKDEASLANFNASYDAFPDVPTGIVKLATKWPVYAESDRPGDIQIEHVSLAHRRQDLDFLCGFGAGIVQLLAEGTFDEAIRRFLQTPGKDLTENARNLLISLEARSSQVDIAIWCATVAALRSRFGKKGFDRREFLHDVEERLAGQESEVDSWVRGCQKVIDAEIDIPSLVDGEKIGRRAALAIILSHEPAGLKELESRLETGPQVRALVAVAVYAFAGLARIDETLKSPSSRMDAVLEVGECVAAGSSVRIEIETSRTANDLTRHQVVKVAGKEAIERAIEPPAYTPAERSERMSRIRSSDTKPEIALRKALHRLGFRFRLHGRRLPGKPDIVLPKHRTVIFVHGCFWHRHPGCRVATTPKTNTDFWIDKFDRNQARDARTSEALAAAGWQVIVVWECELGSPTKVESRTAELAADIISQGVNSSGH